MNKGTYYFPRNRTYQPPTTSGGGGGGGGGIGILPTYPDIDVTASDYTMTDEGIYRVTNNDATHNMIFPDPTLFDGCLIVLINGTGTTLLISSTNQPYLGDNTTNISSVSKNSISEYISINDRWYSNGI